MDLKKDKQKIYSIEAEYYKEHMREASQSSVSQKLNTIIQALMLVLLIIVSFFAYKMIVNNDSGTIFPAHSNKHYVEELAVNKSVNTVSKSSVDEKMNKVVMGVSVVSSEVEAKPQVIPMDIKVVEKVIIEEKVSLATKDTGSKESAKMDILVTPKEPLPVTYIEESPKKVEHIVKKEVVSLMEDDKKSLETDVLSIEYLKEMENALNGIE